MHNLTGDCLLTIKDFLHFVFSPTHADVLVRRANTLRLPMMPKGGVCHYGRFPSLGFLGMPLYCPVMLFVWYFLNRLV